MLPIAHSSCAKPVMAAPVRSGCAASKRTCIAQAAEQPNPNPEPAQVNDAMAKAMQDPEVVKQLQSPAVQAQVQQMASAMANPQLQERMRSLQGDPEFAEMFAEIQKGGMGALMKYWDDPVMLKKLASKLGDVPMAAGPTPAAPPPEPEVNDLFDAAKVGDLEAVEDFIAVGKDINMQDSEKRSPLHYAAAHDHAHILRYLIKQGANMEITDAKNNTPLHYAAGYGRVDIVELLLDSGANTTAQNGTGKTPAEVARLNPQNPVLAIPEIMSRLEINVSA